MPMTTKLGRLVAYLKWLPPKLKPLYLNYYGAYDDQT